VQHIRVFLSSPGDVADERAIALEARTRVSKYPAVIPRPRSI
jgi:hypothetical protein